MVPYADLTDREAGVSALDEVLSKDDHRILRPIDTVVPLDAKRRCGRVCHTSTKVDEHRLSGRHIPE